MLIPDRVVERLAEHGVAVIAGEAPIEGSVRVGVRLEIPAQGEPPRILQLTVKRMSRPVSSAQLASLGAGHPWSAGGLLIICPSVSPSARRRAEELGISLIALNRARSTGPEGHLAIGPGETLPVGRQNSDLATTADRRSVRRAWGSVSVLRALADGDFGTQAQIADRSGVSQPRVSQVLKTLSGQGIIKVRAQSTAFAPAGRAWVVESWADFLEYWLIHYPGPGGIRTNWYGLDQPQQQARTVTELLAKQVRERGMLDPNAVLIAEPVRRPTVLVSGDVAAQAYAPWARPQRAIVYARQGTDLESVGFTPSSAEQATLVLVVPEDPGVWAESTRSRAVFQDVVERSDLPLAGPLQVLFDVAHSRSVDAEQTVEHLKSLMIQHLSGRRL